MAQTTLEKLGERLQTAEAELAALDPQITAALANEAPDAEIAKLRSRRRDLMEQCDDLSVAISFAEGRRNDAARKQEDERAKVLLDAARSQANAFVAAAGGVDEALAQLEQAFNRLKLTELDLSRALRLAGLGVDARIANGLTPALRWAAWKSAPAFSEQSQVPRAEAHRRKSMRDSAARLIPRIQT